METTEKDHAKANAKAWMSSIREMMDGLEKLQTEDDATVTIDGQPYDNQDELRDRIQESPLSVAVRSAWYSPGCPDDNAPAEYEILLSTGGPALRIVGSLGGYCQPDDAELQYQDWGTPWTRYNDGSQEDDVALLEYAQLFYFGE